MSAQERMLSRHQAVLDAKDQRGNHVHWSQTLEPGEVAASIEYVQSVEMWDEMGQPDTLTITVEPGDILNTPVSDPQFKLVEVPRG